MEPALVRHSNHSTLLCGKNTMASRCLSCRAHHRRRVIVINAIICKTILRCRFEHVPCLLSCQYVHRASVLGGIILVKVTTGDSVAPAQSTEDPRPRRLFVQKKNLMLAQVSFHFPFSLRVLSWQVISSRLINSHNNQTNSPSLLSSRNINCVACDRPASQRER